MNILALDIGPVRFTAGRVTARSRVTGIRRIPTPAQAVWESCRELLLDVGGDDEIAAVGIACPGPIRYPAGWIAPAGIRQWRSGFALADAVRRMFPAATVEMASDCHCLTLAEQNGVGVGADTILAGAAILAWTGSRSDDPSPPRPEAGLRTARRRSGRRPSWYFGCRDDEPG